ncbi:MAG: AAA family ATPase [Candidatus Micrarchaeia archaeon]
MEIKEVGERYKKFQAEVSKVIAGKEKEIELIFIGLIANGHILLEGMPGLAKTTMAKTIAQLINCSFGRIQGTPDLSPRDILGFEFYDPNGKLMLIKGPIFNNIVLIDELNRAPPKTQTSLLECMEERQVTFSSGTIPLPKPFIVIATQNPLRIEGTNPIPLVQADRFLFKVEVTYPTQEEEIKMLKIKDLPQQKLERVFEKEEIIELSQISKTVKIDEELMHYIVEIVSRTRGHQHLLMGASPRASIAFMLGAKARALLKGREKVEKEDIRFIAHAVLEHRIAVRSGAGIGASSVVDELLAQIK